MYILQFCSSIQFGASFANPIDSGRISRIAIGYQYLEISSLLVQQMKYTYSIFGGGGGEGGGGKVILS